jgi:hypothetical protein
MRRAFLVVAVSLVVFGCGTAKVSERREVGPAPGAAPTVIYVADFDLETQHLKTETRVLPSPPLPSPPPLPGPLGSVLPSPPGAAPKDPDVRAREIVTLMSKSLVDDLTKAGFTACRLTATEPRLASGWLVRGVFTEVDEGSRMRRAVIGFGAGQTQMQILVAIDDLAGGAPKPFYEADVAADSGRAPGAAPMIVLHPAAAAARFALSGGDLDRSVKQAAEKIAADVAVRVRK